MSQKPGRQRKSSAVCFLCHNSSGSSQRAVQKMNYAVAITAILCITTLLMFALNQGINGLALAGGLTLIGGLGGYVTRAIIKK